LIVAPVLNRSMKKLDESKRELIQQNLHLVKMIASKMAIFLPRHIDYEDLFHDGVIGLMDAAIKFDEKFGKRFSTYASIRIKGSILDSLRAIDWVPRRIRKLSKKINKTREALQQKLKREPSPEEISKQLDLPRYKFNQIVNAVEQSHMFSFEDLQSFSNRYFYPEESINQLHGNNELNDYERVDVKDQLKEALKKLKYKEKLVLSLYYLEDLTLKEIKRILDISEARISQIHTGALKKLRSIISGEKPDKSRKKKKKQQKTKSV